MKKKIALKKVAKKQANASLKKSTKRSAPRQKKLNPLLNAYREMLRARLIDEKAVTLYKQNKCHFQIGCAGHEAVQVATANTMKAGSDWFYPYYRDMALVCALGMSTKELLLNIHKLEMNQLIKRIVCVQSYLAYEHMQLHEKYRYHSDKLTIP